MSLFKDRRQLKYHVVDALCLKPSMGGWSYCLALLSTHTRVSDRIQACISSKPAPASYRCAVNDDYNRDVVQTVSLACRFQTMYSWCRFSTKETVLRAIFTLPPSLPDLFNICPTTAGETSSQSEASVRLAEQSDVTAPLHWSAGRDQAESWKQHGWWKQLPSLPKPWITPS
jgi:hypothetical protein